MRNAGVIVPLARAVYQDFELPFHYFSDTYYDVEQTRCADGFAVRFVRKPFDAPLEKWSLGTDKLYQPWLQNPAAFGVLEDGRLIAAVETDLEDWNKRLRVTELWVEEAHRRQGLGKRLMDAAVARARSEGMRAVVLETQSCNGRAIAFYLAYGFTLIGYDACCYENDDVARREVRMEMGLFL